MLEVISGSILLDRVNVQIQAFKAAGLKSDDRSVSFMESVSHQLSRGRPVSPRQSSWLDKLLEEQPPQIDRISAVLLDEALAKNDIFPADLAEEVIHLSKKISSRAKLSKIDQINLSWIRDELSHVNAGNEPTSRIMQQHQHRVCCLCYAYFSTRSGYYANRPFEGLIADTIFRQYLRSKQITQKQYESLRSIFKSIIAKMEQPKFAESALVKIKPGRYSQRVWSTDHTSRWYWLTETNEVGIVASQPYLLLDEGGTDYQIDGSGRNFLTDLSVDILWDGVLLLVPVENLRKVQRDRKIKKDNT